MEKGEWQKGDCTDQERLEVLAKYLSIFTAPGFVFGEIVPAKEHDGVIELGWTQYGPEAQAFMKDAYNYGWVQGTDWMDWMQTDEAQALSQDPDRMAAASIDDLAKVLTVSFRRDRFVEGSLGADFKRGLITRVIKRAHELAAPAEGAV